MDTVAQVAAFFGTEHLRYDSNSCGGRVNPQADHCLCSIDVEHLITEAGYRFIADDDPRWDACDNAIEKI